MNPEFPDDQPLRDMARQTVDDWNQAMKETVAALSMASASQTPTMMDLKARAATLPNIFVLKENDCNLANVSAFVTAHPDVRDMVEARDKAHVIDFDNLDAADLLKACTALEVVTEKRAGRRHQPAEVHLAAQRRPALLVPALGRSAAGGGAARLRTVVAGSGDRRDRLGVGLHLWRGAGHLREVRHRQRAPGERPAQHRRSAVGQDDQRRARGERGGQRSTRPIR